MEQQRGKYIVIEGHDGTGKSTQIRTLSEQLQEQGKATLIIEEPGSDDPARSLAVANRIRSVIKDGSLQKDGITNLLLFTAARHELLKQRIEPALKLGTYVLSARNWLSTLAYQGYGEGLDLELIESTTREFTSDLYMQPDATIMLLMEDEAERQQRIAKRGALQETPDTFESRNDDFQRRVQQGYSHIAKQYELLVVSANQSIKDVAREVMALLEGDVL